MKHPELSVRRQSNLLHLNRSSLYRQKQPEKSLNLALMRRMDELFTDMPFYGVLKMTEHLKGEGFRVKPKWIRRLMRVMGIEAIYPKPNSSRRNPRHRVYPYLLKNLAMTRPNQVWARDITTIPMARGFVYLVAIMDWYSRYVLSWRISNTLDTGFCLEALEEALWYAGRPRLPVHV